MSLNWEKIARYTTLALIAYAIIFFAFFTFASISLSYRATQVPLVPGETTDPLALILKNTSALLGLVALELLYGLVAAIAGYASFTHGKKRGYYVLLAYFAFYFSTISLYPLQIENVILAVASLILLVSLFQLRTKFKISPIQFLAAALVGIFVFSLAGWTLDIAREEFRNTPQNILENLD